MNVNLKTHCLNDVKFVASPNFGDRLSEQDISLVVIHGISLPPNKFGGNGVEQLFCNKLNPNEHPYYQKIYQLKVSAHLFIKRTGDIIQFVPFSKKAWHAGQSMFDGRCACNDFSIGIELEGTDELPYTEQQYSQLNKILAELRKAYPNITDVVGHSDIAPGRKTDPGDFFDWSIISGCAVSS